ncbi:hypothetical protein HDU96_010272 [Phlyctochytrium bullatum]|nr:hypothetical protein HDU96_010272 [Phlyctochytrium bullatum]
MRTARFLCQQIVADFPDRGILGVDSMGEPEEGEEMIMEGEWVSDLDMKELENQVVVEQEFTNVVMVTAEETGSVATETVTEVTTEVTTWAEKKIVDAVEAPKSALDTMSDLAKALPGADGTDSGHASSAVTGSSTPAEAVEGEKAS